MYTFSEFIFSAPDDSNISAWSVTPEKPRAILQVVHGMMEHSGRYLDFANWMAERGIAVYLNDHLGHGKNLLPDFNYLDSPKEIYGHFADEDGWAGSIEVLHKLRGIARTDFPGMPYFILGHSMGSVMVRSYLRNYPEDVKGVILSGTMLQPRLLLGAGIFLVDILKQAYGPHYRSKLLIALGYGSYNKKFKPKRTEFDWLCSNPKVVDAYIADPLCGFPCTTSFYSDFFRGIRNNLKKPPDSIFNDIDFLIIGGEQDPAGHFGKDPMTVAEYYREYGARQVDLELWPGGRHEMLNEVNKMDVWDYVHRWISALITR